MMNRYAGTLLILALVSVNLPALAQRVAAPMLRTNTPPTVDTHPVAPIAHHRTDPIWTDDFSNSSHWTIGALNGTTDNWVVGTAGPSGTYAIPVIQSTSAANGFALFDSDVMCNVDNGYIATASPIDLSAVAHVQLQFEQFYRKFQGQTFVDVSIDGVSWIPLK